MNIIKKFLAAIFYKIDIYKKMFIMSMKHLLGKTYYKREDNYFNYISETKQLHCTHENISKLSLTKFYCTECGKTFRYVPSEILIISELASIFLIGSIVYILTKTSKEKK